MRKQIPARLKPYLPLQKEGSEENVIHQVEYETPESAKTAFVNAEKKLMQVNAWADLSGPGVTFENYSDPSSEVKENDFIRIKLPVPGSPVKYDWVRVEKIVRESGEQEDLVVIRLRPSEAQDKPDHEIQHFFDEGTSNTFVLWREGISVLAGVFGRNEQSNSHAKSLGESLRDVVVATGARAGLSDLQWNTFVKNLVPEEHETGDD